MKKIFLTLLFFVSIATHSQKRFYPKKFSGKTNAIYVTNSTSKGSLAFFYTIPSDTSKSLVFNLNAIIKYPFAPIGRLVK
jgi:hypothetical protein